MKYILWKGHIYLWYFYIYIRYSTGVVNVQKSCKIHFWTHLSQNLFLDTFFPSNPVLRPFKPISSPQSHLTSIHTHLATPPYLFIHLNLKYLQVVLEICNGWLLIIDILIFILYLIRYTCQKTSWNAGDQFVISYYKILEVQGTLCPSF